MKKLIVILTCIFLSFLVHGQKQSGRQATEKEQKLMDKSHDCAVVNSISLKERLSHYPFNKAKTIQLVSFKDSYDNINLAPNRDSLPRMNDTVCYSKLFEIKDLVQNQIDTLSNLIYNYGFRFHYQPKGNVYYTFSMALCYNPRNAILFLDKDEKVFEFIEICFECHRTKTSSDKVSLGVPCNQKLALIKGFFEKAGIRYGVLEEPENEE